MDSEKIQNIHFSKTNPFPKTIFFNRNLPKINLFMLQSLRKKHSTLGPLVPRLGVG